MRTRTVVFLISTLVLGFLLGMATSAWIRYHQMKEFRAFNSIEGFRVRAINILEPTEEQKEKLIPVITEYGKQNLDLKKKYREEFIALMKEYRSQLYPLLSKEQIERLESRSWKSKEEQHKRGDKGGKQGPDSKPDYSKSNQKTPCYWWECP